MLLPVFANMKEIENCWTDEGTVRNCCLSGYNAATNQFSLKLEVRFQS